MRTSGKWLRSLYASILFIHEHYVRRVSSRLRGIYPAEGYDDDQISRLDEARSGAIQSDLTRSARGGNDVGFKSLAIPEIPDVNGFSKHEPCSFNQRFIERNASLIIEVRAGYRGPVDLGFHQLDNHDVGYFDNTMTSRDGPADPAGG
jgi:hypothetical protein